MVICAGWEWAGRRGRRGVRQQGFINAIIDQIGQGRRMKGGDEFGAPVCHLTGGQATEAG